VKRATTVAGATTALWLLAAGVASAETVAVEDQIADLAYSIDVVWVAICAALVFLMQLGFAMLETGLVRAKNAANIVAKNVADMAIGSVGYFAVGGALAYSAGTFLGTSGFFGLDAFGGDGTQFIFQMVFAATAATIVSGAVAERMKFSGYLIVSLVITAVIYPIVTHWHWPLTEGVGAWLYELGYHDFAGSSIVHMTGGVAALMGAAILGPRIGKYGKDGKPRAIPGHNVPFVVFGAFILWFGWFGFNGGSTLAAAGLGGDIGIILVSTNVAAGAGGLVAGLVTMMRGKFDPTMAANGVLAGLVGITAGTNFATGVEALVIGAICGAVVVFAVAAFDAIKIDDPVGAISVHGVCGALGTLYVGVIASGESNGGFTISLGTQALGVVTIAAFVAVTTGLLFLALKAVGMLRVPEAEEVEGLDVTEHGLEAYPAPGLAGAVSSRSSSVGAVNPATRPVAE
jgi:Amt family ammonium transporter